MPEHRHDQPAPAQAPHLLTARMSEIVVAAEGEKIRTLLGSCVGVAIYDRRAGIGGLAHVVLPSSSGHDGPPGKFVDTAVPELIERLFALGARKSNLAAKLAGGARMFETQAIVAIGEQNLTAAEQELKMRRIPVIGRHCGGQQGRRMTFLPQTGHTRIEIVGHEPVEI